MIGYPENECTKCGGPLEPEPCRHLTDFAAVTNFHEGHCCFWPPDQDCHPAEVAEWERQMAARRPGGVAVLTKRANS